jgi:hypothetical protein
VKIDNEKFKALQNWMYRNARPLELAKWKYNIESGTKEEVLGCLKAFQNSDGGFGHGIEPDFWNPGSTPMASWTAAQILKEIDAKPEEEIVRKLVKYLMGTLEPKTGMWSSTVPENNLYPHAPWWQWSEGAQDNWMFNPSAELSAYLIHWSSWDREAWEIGWQSMEKGIRRLMKVDEMDRHELSNFKNALEILRTDTKEFNEKIPYSFQAVEKKVWELIEDCINKDCKKWGSDYLPLPLDFITHPKYLENYQNPAMKKLVKQNLIYYANSLNEEGVWDITWNWDQYPEAFAVAKRIWKGVLIANRCKLFKEFNWIASKNSPTGTSR